MGLLTDPSAGQGRLTKALLRFHIKLEILLYIGGIVYFCSLAYTPFNLGTYFSENALLPGLVKSEFRDDHSIRIYHQELLDEMNKYTDSLPYPWLLAKFKQIGLDTYTHNFTLNYPLGKSQRFTGKNVYGILRASRASSTEALVLSVPYRTPSSMQPTTAPSIAIMLAFAKFAIKEKYWAKDLIFLITEHEQLGMQAWLEAYYGATCGNLDTLDSGDLKGRGGAIQAAINLEIHDTTIGQVDIKIEGLNGQLPNLDLFNLACKMCVKEGIYYTFKNRPSKSFKDPIKDWLYSFQTLMSMVSTQATGIPNGNHGLYHRFGIQALTIEAFSKTTTRGISKANLLNMGRAIEGIFRSLNNLLERFHQSFFFYLLASSERFVSISLYMPAIGAIAAALFIRACAKWCQLQDDNATIKDEKLDDRKDHEKIDESLDKYSDEYWEVMKFRFLKDIEDYRPPVGDSANFISVLFLFVIVHIMGVLIMNSPQFLTNIGNQYNYSTNISLFYSLIIISIFLLTLPLFTRIINFKNASILNILSLLELGTVLVSIAMNNISLAMFLGVIYVPVALLISATPNRFHSSIQKVFWIILHPLVLLTIIVLVYTYYNFSNDSLKEIISRSVNATQQAIVFSVVDSMIYGNWLFSVVSCVFLPNWLCFWIVSFNRNEQKLSKVDYTKKTN